MFPLSRLRPVARIFLGRRGDICRQSRNSSSQEVWYYRRLNDCVKSRHTQVTSTGAMAFLWWWMLCNCWYNPEEVLGAHFRPDPSKWSDEKLGIPPDDVD